MREVGKINIMLQALFNVFAVTKLTHEELNKYISTIIPLQKVDPELYDLECKKADLAKKLVTCIAEIESLVVERSNSN